MPIIKMRKLIKNKIRENPEQYRKRFLPDKTPKGIKRTQKTGKKTVIEKWDKEGIPEKRIIITKGKKIREFYDSNGKIDATIITRKKREKIKTHKIRKLFRKKRD
ncbi:MAG: hypothetical protein COT90_02350 [Candidatus Diapherotrites archaeon CG10_big_fil_rev_8_21_14_0_10_31_34]|nr:MAG: hypothetical protein COT90_02350 [Candidatus Diapherotrites archaeon CG10_big_fil_rev_8_21_14_0_10_31_34]